MFSQFESLSKASSLVLRIGTDAHLYDDPDDVSIAPLLDSKFDSEKVEALKRLLALIAQGVDVANYFPQVVKNVASQSLETKKLVYLYLLHYAEKRPNEALLSINCFQKDLSDTNPLVRAYALRAIAGIRLHSVAPLVLVAIGKCTRDPSPYVRKCAAHALTKLHDLHLEENISALEELIGLMLNDNSPGVIGAAAIAFKSVCPNNLPLIGKNFKRLCETLPDVEEWGQIILIELLLRYIVARHGLVKESILCSSHPEQESMGANMIDMSESNGDSRERDVRGSKINSLMYRYYFEGHEELSSQSDFLNKQTSGQNDDVKLLLQCTSPLLWSQNSGVVLAASSVHWIMAPWVEVNKIVKPLLFTLRSSPESKYVVLCNIQMLAKAVPSLFASYFEDFFISSSDVYQTRVLKLEILSVIAADSSIYIILDEFQDYIRDPDRRFVADVIAAIGLCAQKINSVASICLEWLLAIIIQGSNPISSSMMDGGTSVLVQSILSFKAIVKQDPVCHEKMIVKLFRILDKIKDPAARALIVWIAGEYCSIGQIIPKVLPTILQYLAHCFTIEDLGTKQQILNTTAKAVLSSQSDQLMFKRIFSYVIELAKYDIDYDIRDRARFFEKLIHYHIDSLSHKDLSLQATRNLFRNDTPQGTFLDKNNRVYLPGSLSQIVLHAAPGYVPLPKLCSENDETLNFTSGDNDDMSDPESSYEESGSNYDSEHSYVSSVCSEESGGRNDINSEYTDTLLSTEDATGQPSQSTTGIVSKSVSSGLADMMSNSALESWLDEKSSLPTDQKIEQQSTPRVSINDLHIAVKPKLHTLLESANGNGLKVEYSFSTEVSNISPLLVCVEVFCSNHSTEQMNNIFVNNVNQDGNSESADLVSEKPESEVPTVIPTEKVACLNPGETARKILQVRFPHHLLPIKIGIFCNEKKYSTKLWPEIGYFLRPFSMSVEAFTDMESHLRGMFEYSKSCTFDDHIGRLQNEKKDSIQDDNIVFVSRCLASKVLSNANLYLLSTDLPVSFNIDDASGLRLRFSGEILSTLKPCLITLLAEGNCLEPLKVTVKINCEETTFGLNMLNRLVALLH